MFDLWPLVGENAEAISSTALKLFEYLKLADTIATEIADGTLKPGDRLPPQHSFAYERKLAVSTASRVYTELLRRGLVIGELGRDTCMSGEARRRPGSGRRPPRRPD
jgi:DNA-binding transcriptional regulator YhcF (GntR family)